MCIVGVLAPPWVCFNAAHRALGLGPGCQVWGGVCICLGERGHPEQVLEGLLSWTSVSVGEAGLPLPLEQSWTVGSEFLLQCSQPAVGHLHERWRPCHLEFVPLR